MTRATLAWLLICLGFLLILFGRVAADAKPRHLTKVQKLERRLDLLERRTRHLTQQLHAEQAARTKGDDDLYNGAYWTQPGCVLQMVGVGGGWSSVTLPGLESSGDFMLFQAPGGGQWAAAYVPLISPHCLGGP